MAKKQTTADKKKAAAATAQGAKLLAAQKAGTYTAPKVTPAAQARPVTPAPTAPKAPAPAPSLPKTSAPVSQVSSYKPTVSSPALGNQKTGTSSSTSSSSGSKSSSSHSSSSHSSSSDNTPVTRGANVAQSLAGLTAVTNAVSNALTNKSSSPITSSSNTGRTGAVSRGIDAAQQQANRVENTYKELTDVTGWKSTIANETKDTHNFLVGMKKADNGADKRRIISEYNNSDTAKKAYELGMGIAGNSEGVAKVAGATARTIGQYVKALETAGRPLTEAEIRKTASQAINDGYTSETVGKLIEALNKKGIIKGSGVTTFGQHFDDAFAASKGGASPTSKSQAPKAPKAEPPAKSAAAVEAGMKPQSSAAQATVEKIQQMRRARSEAGWGKKPGAVIDTPPPAQVAGQLDAATRGMNRAAEPVRPQETTGYTAGVGKQTPINERVQGGVGKQTPINERVQAGVGRKTPIRDSTTPKNMFDFGADIRSGLSKLGNPRVGMGVLGATGAAALAGGAMYSGSLAPQPGATQATSEYADGDAILGITSRTASPTSGAASPSAAVSPTLSSPSVSQLSSTASVSAPTYTGNSSGGYPASSTLYPSGGGTVSSGGGYAYNNTGGGKNAVETMYYTLDENGQPISEHIGYIINGQTFVDPNGQTPVPENSLVRTVTKDGTENYYLKNDAYSNGQGGYNPYSSIGPGGTNVYDSLGQIQPQVAAPEEEVVTAQDDIMQQVIDALTPQLESQYAQIDTATEQRIAALKENYAARGILNSDALATEIDRIIEEGEAEKDSLYGQVLAQAYQSAMTADYQTRALEQDQSQFESTQQINQQKMEQDAMQFAAQLGLDYQKLSLSEKQMLLDEAYRQEELKLGYYKASQPTAASTKASNQPYDNMTELNAVVMDALSNPGLTPTQAAQYIKMTAQTLPGVTQEQISQAWSNYKAMRGTATN